MNVGTQMYNLLKESTAEMKKITGEIQRLEDRKKNDHLDARYIQAEIDPQIMDLRVKRNNLKDSTEVQIRRMAEAHREAVKNSHRLEGGELTDDAKLFSFPGLLKPEDIEAIMDRNQGNHTMLQLAVRYADQNKLKINRVYDSGKAAEINATNDLEGTSVMYVRNWMETGAADEMLGRFFLVGDQQ